MTTTHSLADTIVWTALITPMHADGSIDFNTLTLLVREQEQAGNGILILGSTGEALALSIDEQQAVVRHVTALTLRVPLMVGVGGFNLSQQLQWLSFCNQHPIDAYLLGAPLYAKPGIQGQLHWYSALLDASKKPCMLYNVPGRAAVSIPPTVLAQLQQHPLCWALKEASGDIAQFEAYREAAPELTIFSGDDALIPYFAQAGAAGLVSVAANVWPQQTQHLVQQCLQGQSVNAFVTWRSAIDALFSAANPVPVKCLLHALERLNSPVLRPPLSHLELNDTQPLLNAHERIVAWAH